MFDKLKHIATGWGKWAGILATTPEEAALSVARMQACGNCEFATESKAMAFINGGVEQYDTLSCSVCKCPCHQKSLSNDVCPLGKWNFLTAIN